MKRSNLSVSDLEAFLALAETCNYRKAAEKLHVSQPALSRIIQAVEGRLQARLFDRNTRRVELTSAGSELLPIARRIVGEFHDSLSDLSEFVSGRSGRITIACLPSAAAALLPSTMFRFENTHPKVKISLIPVSNEFVRDMVADGRADFGISVAPGTRTDEVLFEPFAHDDFVLLCSRRAPWAKRREISWRELVSMPLIASGPASSIRPIMDSVLADVGVDNVPRYEATNISVVGAMVAAGLGVATIPRLALRLIDVTDLSVIRLVDPVVHRQIGVMTRKGRSLSAAATSFLDSLLHA